MALKHRVIQRIGSDGRPHDEIRAVTDAAIAKWLTRNPNHIPDLSIPLRKELTPIGAGYRASFHRMDVDGGEAMRWRFLVGRSPHIYLSTITVLLDADNGTDWLWYDVETRRDDSRFAPPKLTRYLTEDLAGSPRDRISQFTEGMRRVNAQDIGAFLDEVLEAEDRVVPAFVSGDPKWSLPAEMHVERALADLYGIATFWKLAPDAFDEFNSFVHEGYRVLPGSVHAFQHGLDVEDGLDVRRHWWFSSAEVRQSRPSELSRRLHTEAMRTGLQVRRPEPLMGLNQSFERDAASSVIGYFENILAATRPSPATLGTHEDRSGEPVVVDPEISMERVEEVSSSGPSDTDLLEPSALAATMDADISDLISETATEFDVSLSPKWSLRRRLTTLFDTVRKRLSTLTEAIRGREGIEQLKSQIETLVVQKGRLETENEELNELLEVQDQEARETADTLDQQRLLTARERRRGDHFANELGRIATEQQAAVDWQVPRADPRDVVNLGAPESVDDLFERFARMEYVRFTGDRKIAETIRDAKLRDVILRDVWTYMSELETFARLRAAGKINCGLAQYVDMHSTRVTANQFANDESNSVKNTKKFAEPRTLPVPYEVDPSGQAFMGAHFRLSRGDGQAMRMHCYDATDADGRVYVGYIGPHLPSRRSN